ncbi:hypothetical protein [Streptomyces purpureus]|uniref:hypothetical protein n=1 Tax=Streptomyces purpureus TaxID=1951 RepID=UPI00037A8606|nr:hypothetical protein [Streptomyces purpureus]
MKHDPRGRACALCHSITSANGAPVIVIAVQGGADVYACATHRAELAVGSDDPVVATAQYQDMARRRTHP